MKRFSIVATSLFIISLVLSSIPEVNAQPSHPRQSPIDLTRTTIDDTYIKVVYGKPYKRDREIFGELVPYGAVWRTGANEATEITFTDDVIFGDEEVEAGVYSLFTIPGEESWTIILNNQLGAWGAFQYNQELDVLRLEVPVQKLDEIVEAFAIRLETEEDASETTLSLQWDLVRVEVEIASN